MNNNLIVYKNCSRGGVSSVIRGRARANPEAHFDAVFELNKGGIATFADFPNLSCRVVGSRLADYTNHILANRQYDRVSVLSNPQLANTLEVPDSTELVYEIHSGAFSVVKKEMDVLDQSRIDVFRVPSQYSAFHVLPMIKPRFRRRLEVVPNLVDTYFFNAESDAPYHMFSDEITPLIWVGRFDRGKGPKYLLRLLAQLPERFHAFVVISLETQPGPASDFFAEAASLRVEDRVHLRMNLSSSELASFYRGAARRGGSFISTSLVESFGYALVEAPSCGLNVVAFDLPVIQEHSDFHTRMTTVQPGNVEAMAEVLTGREA